MTSQSRRETAIVLRRLTLRQKWQLWRGSFRRHFLRRFRKAYVAAQEAKRKGSCLRCGACCHLSLCPWRKEIDGLPGCRIYAHRSGNCWVFPIDKQDLADRDLLLPDRPCGFYFED